MVRINIAAVLVVFVIGVLLENAQCARTTKKYSAVARYPAGDDGTSEVEGDFSEDQQQSMQLSVKEIVPSADDKLKCSEDGSCKRKKKVANSTTDTALAASSSGAPAPGNKQQTGQELPMTMYQYHWRNRLRNSTPVQMGSQRLLAKLQRASLDMARGILSGLGWEIQGWEMVLLESIVKMVSKDLLFMMQLFF